MKLRDNARFSTICIHAGQEPDPSTGAIITPIYQTSTYVQDALGQHKGYEYARTQNPTRAALEANIAAIEGGRAAFAFASGMAAEGAIMTLLQSGDHVVVTDNTYGGTYRLFERVLRKYQLDFSYVDTSDTAAIERRIRPATKMLFLETPTNPVLRLTDLRAACDARARPRRVRGGRQHLCQPVRAAADRASAPTSSCTAPRSSSTATATASAASSSPCATTTSSGCGSSRTPRGRSSGRWTRGWCCAAPRRCRSGWSGTTPTRWRSRSSWPRTRRCAQVHYPGLPVASAARAGDSGRCAASAALISFRARLAREGADAAQLACG